MSPPEPLRRVAVASDLHLFARRTRGRDLLGPLTKAAARTGTLVLAGDIVDVRWSTLGGPEATARATDAWVRDVLAGAPSAEVHYVLGNHDDTPEIREVLGALSGAEERFNWHPRHLRLGSALFVHGDVDRPRKSNHGSTPGPARERAYAAAIALHLHRAAAAIAFPHRAVLRGLHRYANRLEASGEEPIRDVFFGHTHRPVARACYRGRRYHNGGAPIDGVDFRIIEEDIS